ncbi:hypothetical protein [Exiguobacterium qingdaonense]|uniref:hypothetical protein n=1 Tax=Exiguobacterium qingdaonense TaxID=2751251 RepID=UPI001BED2DB8|nr:hypothetical protein [Exiguobacterium qingdaonense]
MIASNFVPGLNVVGKAAKAARATYKAVSTARATYRVAKTAVKTNAKRAASRTLHVTKTVGTKSIRKAKKVTATVKAKARQRFTRKSQAKTSGSSTVSQRNVKTETRSQSSENAKSLNELLKLDLQFFAGKGTGEYSKVGGHHVHAKSAFEENVNYDPKKGFSISQSFMKDNGLNHQQMTNKQRELFKELNESGRPNTLKEHTRIGVEALIAGGATRQEARDLVAASLKNLRQQGVREPNNIPWYK